MGVETLRQNLIFLRKDHKLSQRQFAYRLSVSINRVGSWEEGRATPQLETLVRIKNTFAISIDTLVRINLEEINGNKKSYQ
jgi:transcriptional regulator with XRE-family HTH domain